MRIRAARVGEAPRLSKLAVEAKATWGYSRRQLGVWASELTVTPGSIERRLTCVAELGCEIAGFYQIATHSSRWELEHFWVHPSFMRQGVGRAMFSHAARAAADAGCTELAIDADPNAEAFYIACGAERIGVVPAPTDTEPVRVRPQLRLVL